MLTTVASIVPNPTHEVWALSLSHSDMRFLLLFSVESAIMLYVASLSLFSFDFGELPSSVCSLLSYVAQQKCKCDRGVALRLFMFIMGWMLSYAPSLCHVHSMHVCK